MGAVPGDRISEPRLRLAEAKQLFECAETSQAVLDTFFHICALYFPACTLLLFQADAAIVRRVHRPDATGGVGAQFSFDQSAALGPIRNGAQLGPAAVIIEADDPLVTCGAVAPGAALVLPLSMRGRTVAAVVGVGPLDDNMRKAILAITAEGEGCLARMIVRRQVAAATRMSEATRIMSVTLTDDGAATQRQRRLVATLVSGATGLLVTGAMLFWLFGGRKSSAIVAASDLPGAASGSVDAISLVAAARAGAALGEKADLVSVRAVVGPNGLTDLTGAPLGEDPTLARLVFALDKDVAELHVDSDGLQPPTKRLRELRECGPCGCDVAAPPPACSVAKVLVGARTAGLEPEERAVVLYAFCASEGPRWTVSVPGRGQIRLSDGTCAPLPREVLPPRPRSIETIPGAPHAIDPLALLPEARHQAGLSEDAVLVSIDAWFVDKNGRVDLAGPTHRGHVEYTFADPPRSPTNRVRRVVLDALGMSVRPESLHLDVLPAPPPRCTPARLWHAAMPDAPESALGRITYEGAKTDSGHGGLWTLELGATSATQRRSDGVCAVYD